MPVPGVDSGTAAVYHDNNIGFYTHPDRVTPRVTLHYCKYVMLRRARNKAAWLVPALGITSTDFVVIVGAGYGYLARAIKELANCPAVSVDTGGWIQANKTTTETADLEGWLNASGIPPGHEKHAAVLAALDDGDPRNWFGGVMEPVQDYDISKNADLVKLRQDLGDNPTWAISDSLLEWTTDNEATVVDAQMRNAAPNVCHYVIPFDELNGQVPDSSPYNWKLPTPDVRDDQGNVIAIPAWLTDQAWYTVTDWRTLLGPGSLIATERWRVL